MLLVYDATGRGALVMRPMVLFFETFEGSLYIYNLSLI